MKKLLLLLFLPVLLFAQKNILHTAECRITLINTGSSWNVTFVAAAIDAKWDENYQLTADYNSAVVIVPDPQYPLQTIAEFDLINDPIAGIHPIMALGLYKISAIESGVVQDSFYMDWRTSNYAESPDVYFKYDVGNNVFKNNDNTQTISGTTQTVWDLVDGITHVTTGLELYTNLSNSNGNPYLSWSQYHVSGSTYFVHKKLTTESGTMTTQYSTGNTHWTDDDFTIGSPRFTHDKVEYWITASLSGGQQSLDGNNVNANGTSWIQWKLGADGNENILSFDLSQNYPNPFNPTTQINYQLPKESFVNIKVYNMLGKEVANLVNSYKTAGNYSIEFNASKLSTGTYIYKIIAGNFTDVKKMLLLK